MRNLQSVIVKSFMLLLYAMPFASLAATDQAMPPQGVTGQARFDWIKHTQVTLDELKTKLNLNPTQIPAWDTWTAGVVGDAHNQLLMHADDCHHGMRHHSAWINESTPDQMTHGIACLRAEMTRMQEHLVQLEAAQVRTKIFYDTLGPNQKTIFDLFWHEMYHRASGHHGGSNDNDDDDDDE